MIEFVPLTAEMVLGIDQFEPIHAEFALTPDVAVELEHIGGWAAIADGEVVAVGGVMRKWEGSGMAWTWLGRGWRSHARKITDFAAGVLDDCRLDRVEAAVKFDYERGHAWMRRLGFSVETPRARNWGPDGDYTIYVRVK